MSDTRKYSTHVKWPEGYCLDPNGVMCCPEGAHEHWSFGYDLGYADALAVRAALAATPTPLADAAAIAERPVYVFLVPGDVIQATDERYSAEYCKWKPIAPLYVGTTVEASTRPVRRAIPARAALATDAIAPETKTGCSCETCRPLTMTDMRMVLCETCGNKRCPHATNHRNDCTGSNEVGQKGSSWEHVKTDAIAPTEGEFWQSNDKGLVSRIEPAPSPKPAVDALTTGAVEGEPVAWARPDLLERLGSPIAYSAVTELLKKQKDGYMPLYTHPASEQKALTDSDVYTLIGHADYLRGIGQEDMPTWCMGLAERIARTIGDKALADRTALLADRGSEGK